MASSKLLIPILALMCFLFTSEAEVFLVGGRDNAWTNPPDPYFLAQWAESTQFKIGDSLIFQYDGKTDSVLEVRRDDYLGCIKSKPIKEYKGGNSQIELSSPGRHFFINGAGTRCPDKLMVVVMSEKHKHSKSPVSAPALN